MSTPPLRRWYAVLVLLLVATGTLLVGAAPAGAHTDLLRSNPEPGASVTGRLERVQLAFSSAVLPRLVEVVVTRTTDGTRVSGRAAAFDDTVVVPVTRMTAGRYRVDYRVVAADGHPITGEYAFVVRASASAEVAAVVAPIAPSAPSGTPPWLVPLLAGLGALVVVGHRVLHGVRRTHP